MLMLYQDYVVSLLSDFAISKGLTTIIKKNTMKFWRIAFLMLAALSFASCSSDEKENPFTADSTQ